MNFYKALLEALQELASPPVIHKAFNPIAKDFLITKSWSSGSTTFIEGWISTEDQDLQEDIVLPEAFQDSLDGYFRRAAPISLNHDLKKMPVGHVQKAAIVRNGQVVHSASHPRDAAEFEHFPGSGSGLYGRCAITDIEAAKAVDAGNIGAFSWIGNATEYQPLTQKGKRILKVNPLIEVTLAAYPVNQHAVILAAKSYGLEDK